MKRSWFLAVLMVCAWCCALLLGCKPVVSDAVYTQYSYDTTTNRFVPVGTQLSFGANNTAYTICYLDSVSLFGSVTPVASGYLLTANANAFLQIGAALNDLTSEQKTELTEEMMSVWNNSVVSSEQLFLQGNYLFSSSNVDLIRMVRAGENKSTYTAIEGYYESAADSNRVYLFKEGKVYGNQTDDNGNRKDDADGNPIMSDVANATYTTLNNGFLMLTRVGVNGETLYNSNGTPNRIVYLLSSISYPKNLADFVYTEDDYSETVKALAAELAGKSVGVLTKTLYSTTDLSQLDFN